MVHRRTLAFALFLAVAAFSGCGDNASNKTKIGRGSAGSAANQKCSIAQTLTAESKANGSCLNVKRILSAISALGSECQLRVVTKDVSALSRDTLNADRPRLISSPPLQAALIKHQGLFLDNGTPSEVLASEDMKARLTFEQTDCKEVSAKLPSGEIKTYKVDPSKSRVVFQNPPPVTNRTGTSANSTNFTSYQAKQQGLLYLENKDEIVSIRLLRSGELSIATIYKNVPISDKCDPTRTSAAVRSIHTLNWGTKTNIRLQDPTFTPAMASLMVQIPGVHERWAEKAKTQITAQAEQRTKLAKAAKPGFPAKEQPEETDTAIPIPESDYITLRDQMRNMDTQSLPCP